MDSPAGLPPLLAWLRLPRTDPELEGGRTEAAEGGRAPVRDVTRDWVVGSAPCASGRGGSCQRRTGWGPSSSQACGSFARESSMTHVLCGSRLLIDKVDFKFITHYLLNNVGSIMIMQFCTIEMHLTYWLSAGGSLCGKSPPLIDLIFVMVSRRCSVCSPSKRIRASFALTCELICSSTLPSSSRERDKMKM